MNTTALRQQLHEYIDAADEKKIEAMFTLLQADMAHTSSYTDEELKTFYDRREKYLRVIALLIPQKNLITISVTTGTKDEL